MSERFFAFSVLAFSLLDAFAFLDADERGDHGTLELAVAQFVSVSLSSSPVYRGSDTFRIYDATAFCFSVSVRFCSCLFTLPGIPICASSSKYLAREMNTSRRRAGSLGRCDSTDKV